MSVCRYPSSWAKSGGAAIAPHKKKKERKRKIRQKRYRRIGVCLLRSSYPYSSITHYVWARGIVVSTSNASLVDGLDLKNNISFNLRYKARLRRQDCPEKPLLHLILCSTRLNLQKWSRPREVSNLSPVLHLGQWHCGLRE